LTKIERVKRALRGDEVDRPPFSFWYHFGLQHLPGSSHARAELEFFRAYDLDFLKVMSDYPYPLPTGVAVVQTRDDWRAVEPVSADDRCWEQQNLALSMIADELCDEAYFIETVFSPWTTARRMTTAGGLRQAMQNCPEDLLHAMDSIAVSLAAYSSGAVSRGAAGIFLSLGAASEDVLTPSEYEVWGRPFDMKVLDAVRDAPFNVLHIHGNRILFEHVLDYSAQAFNWSHFSTAPSLVEGKRLARRTVMGGVNEANASRVSPLEIAAQIRQTVDETGSSGLIITPGCSVPTDTPVRNLMAIRFAAEQCAATNKNGAV